MNSPFVWVVAAALLGLVLVFAGRGLRRSFGLGPGHTVALDNVLLTSERLGPTGCPDRLIRWGRMVIPAEWKSSRSVWPRACYALFSPAFARRSTTNASQRQT